MVNWWEPRRNKHPGRTQLSSPFPHPSGSPYLLPLTLHWTLAASGAQVQWQWLCAGSGAHRASIHGGNRSLAPGHTPMLNLSLPTNGVQKAEEKPLQPPAQLMAEQRYPPLPLCSFLLILLSLNSEIPGRGQSLCQTAWSQTRYCRRKLSGSCKLQPLQAEAYPETRQSRAARPRGHSEPSHLAATVSRDLLPPQASSPVPSDTDRPQTWKPL